MTRKRRKHKASMGGAECSPNDNSQGPEVDAATGEGAFDSLPNETLLLILARLSSPSKQYAALVCRHWHDLLLEPPFCRHLGRGQTLSAALQGCAPGDTLIVPPGMYQETLLVEHPVRLVAADLWAAQRTRLRGLRAPGAPPPHTPAGPAAATPSIPTPAAAAVKLTRGPSSPAGGPSPAGAGEGAGPGPGTLRIQQQRQQHQLQHHRQQHQPAGEGPRSARAHPAEGAAGEAAGGGYWGAVAGGIEVGGGVGGARPLAPSVAVMMLRPPVVVMNSRCCFVGFEFHTSTAHNEVSICCFGPDAPVARFEHCTFSGLTGLRVPYSKGSQTRLELYDCMLVGTTQTLAAVQMDAGQLVAVRCCLQNNAVGLEVGPSALARLAGCDLRWCGTALVVDGCLAMAHCRIWGNGKVANGSSDARLRAAQSHSLACLEAAHLPAHPPPPHGKAPGFQPGSASGRSRRAPAAPPTGPPDDAPQQQAAASRTVAAAGPPGSSPAAVAIGGAGSAEAANAATGSSGPWASAAGPSGPGAAPADPGRVAALAAAQWSEVAAAFAGGHQKQQPQQVVRVVDCEVAAPQLIMRAGLHKEVRKQARQLVRQVYGAPDDDQFPEWEVLVQSDLDSELDEDDSSVNVSGSGALDEDSELLEGEEEEDPLNAADDPDLDESVSESGSSGSGSDFGSDATSQEAPSDEGEADGEAGASEGEEVGVEEESEGGGSGTGSDSSGGSSREEGTSRSGGTGSSNDSEDISDSGGGSGGGDTTGDSDGGSGSGGGTDSGSDGDSN